jgi:predicted negative regulator of RcsB-dependent stress response
MSTDQIDEYEQGERVRKWLRDNGVSIIGGIGIGFAAILGFQAWQASKAGHREEAARQYGSFLQAQEGGNADQAAALAESCAPTTPTPPIRPWRRCAVPRPWSRRAARKRPCRCSMPPCPG